MKFYADTSVRRALQIAGDLALVAWVWVWVVIAQKVHGATLELATPGRRIDASAGDLASRLGDTGRTVSDIPLVGEGASKPFDGAGDAANGLAQAGQQQAAAVESLAQWLALGVALIPILVLLWFYLPQRIAFVRRATAGQRFLDSGADLDLFALRAMAHQPLHVRARIDPDPAGAWRRGVTEVIDQLAGLELRSAGLRSPAGLSSSATRNGRVTP